MFPRLRVIYSKLQIYIHTPKIVQDKYVHAQVFSFLIAITDNIFLPPPPLLLLWLLYSPTKHQEKCCAGPPPLPYLSVV